MHGKRNTYYIGELAEALGLSKRAIRYYEELGFIYPNRTTGGFRKYSEFDADILRMVLRFKDLGMSLEEIKAILLPNHNNLNSVTLSNLRETLKLRRQDFVSKIQKYNESIEQIDSVLKLLARCSNCGASASGHLCSDCLRKHQIGIKKITLFVSTLLGAENKDET